MQTFQIEFPLAKRNLGCTALIPSPPPIILDDPGWLCMPQMKQFCIQWQVIHVLASPKFSSSNHSLPSQSPADAHSSGSLEILNKQREKNFLLKDFRQSHHTNSTMNH